MTHYQVLGISKTASAAEIKKAYRKLAVKYHPDKNPDDRTAEKKMKAVNEAYDILSDSISRSKYDREITPAPKSRAYGQSAYEDARRAQQYQNNTPSNPWKTIIRNAFEDLTNGPDDSAFFRTIAHERQEGATFRADLDISPSFAATGGKHQISYERADICSFCKYAGCGACGGLGYRRVSKTVNLDMPPGLFHGQKIRIAELGHIMSVTDGVGDEYGDLVLTIHITDHNSPHKMNGSDIYVDCTITLEVAVYGGPAIVNTINGPVRIMISPKTQDGKKLRIAGSGTKDARTKKVGDCIVTIKVDIPKFKSLSQERCYDKYLTYARKY